MANTEKLVIGLGEKFYPFGNMERLRASHLEDTFGRSHPFYLEGIGEGDISLVKIGVPSEQRNLYLLLPENSKRTVLNLRRGVGMIESTIYKLDPEHTFQPNLWCRLYFDNKSFIAYNSHAIDTKTRNDPKEFAVFFNFTRGKRKPYNDPSYGDIIVPNSISFLHEIAFSFDF